MSPIDYTSGEMLLALSAPTQKGSRKAARALFDRAFRQSCLERLRCRLSGRNPRLLELDEVTGGRHPGQCYGAGLQIVPVDRIRGSDGRSRDFVAGFYPGKQSLRSRWEHIASLQLSGEAMPPVELIRIGEIYFVRDGHHRVSTARALGVLDIEAEVTVWEHCTENRGTTEKKETTETAEITERNKN